MSDDRKRGQNRRKSMKITLDTQMFLQKLFGRSFPALIQHDPSIVIQDPHVNAHGHLKRIRLEMSACIFSRMTGVMSVISMYRVI